MRKDGVIRTMKSGDEEIIRDRINCRLGQVVFCDHQRAKVIGVGTDKAGKFVRIRYE